jgi:hypothetical protein
MNVDRIHWTSILPLAPNKSRWVRHVLVSPESTALANFSEIVDRLRTSGLHITAEDVAVNTLQQQGAASSYAEGGRLCHLEKPVWQRITSVGASSLEGQLAGFAGDICPVIDL